jgi:hypothetical protein
LLLGYIIPQQQQQVVSVKWVFGGRLGPLWVETSLSTYIGHTCVAKVLAVLICPDAAAVVSFMYIPLSASFNKGSSSSSSSKEEEEEEEQFGSMMTIATSSNPNSAQQ